MTMFLNCGALRSLRLALRASLVILVSIILLHAIISRMKARIGKDWIPLTMLKIDSKRFKRTHKHRKGLLEIL